MVYYVYLYVGSVLSRNHRTQRKEIEKKIVVSINCTSGIGAKGGLVDSPRRLRLRRAAPLISPWAAELSPAEFVVEPHLVCRAVTARVCT